MRLEVQRKEQDLMQLQAKMKTVEEQHADYQKHIAVLKESLIAKEEHYNMLQMDVSSTGISSQIRSKLRDWALRQAKAGCYSQAALSSNDSKTLYTSLFASIHK